MCTNCPDNYDYHMFDGEWTLVAVPYWNHGSFSAPVSQISLSDFIDFVVAEVGGCNKVVVRSGLYWAGYLVDTGGL